MSDALRTWLAAHDEVAPHTIEGLYVVGSDYNATNKVYCVDTPADTLVRTWDVGLGPVAIALWRAPGE